MAAQIDSPEFRIPPEEVQKLYREYREAVVRFFQKHHRREGIDDLVQAVYEEALAARPRKAVEEPLKYLFGIALNVLHSDYRRTRRERARFVTVDPHDLESAPDRSALWCVASEEGSTEVLQQQLRDALDELPKACQVAFTRSRRDGWSYNDIAGELGVTPHAVKKYIVRTLSHLRSRLRATR